MKDNEIKLFRNKILLINVVILLVTIIMLLILRKYSWIIGYLLGSITSYITFSIHVNSVSKVGKTDKNERKRSIASALFRFLISAACLSIALFIGWINIIATFIGLLVIKLTIIVYGFITEIKKERKGGNTET